MQWILPGTVLEADQQEAPGRDARQRPDHARGTDGFAEIGPGAPRNLAGVREAIYRRAAPVATQHLTISTLDSMALGGVGGAARMAIEAILCRLPA